MSEIGLADQAFQQVKNALFKATQSGQQQQSQQQGGGGGGESRVAAGSGITSGQWTVGSDGPTQTPTKPNPYAHGQKKPATKPAAKRPAAKKPPPKKAPAKPKPSAHQQHLQHLHNIGAAARARQSVKLHGQLKALTGQLSNLYAEKKKLSSTGVHSFGTSSTVKPAATTKPAKPAASATAAKPASTTSTTAKPKPATAASAAASKLASVNQQIAQVKGQIAQVKAQIAQLATIKSVGNPRELATGRFRTFQGEVEEAKQALAEGRSSDAAELLGSARALAQDPGQRLVVGNLQAAIGRVQHNVVQPEVVKLTPKVVYARGS